MGSYSGFYQNCLRKVGNYLWQIEFKEPSCWEPWCTPVGPATLVAEVGGKGEPRSSETSLGHIARPHLSDGASNYKKNHPWDLGKCRPQVLKAVSFTNEYSPRSGHFLVINSVGAIPCHPVQDCVRLLLVKNNTLQL